MSDYQRGIADGTARAPHPPWDPKSDVSQRDWWAELSEVVTELLRQGEAADDIAQHVAILGAHPGPEPYTETT